MYYVDRWTSKVNMQGFENTEVPVEPETEKKTTVDTRVGLTVIMQCSNVNRHFRPLGNGKNDVLARKVICRCQRSVFACTTKGQDDLEDRDKLAPPPCYKIRKRESIHTGAYILNASFTTL